MVTRILALAVAGVVLAGCTVGPDYVRPGLPAVDRFANAPAQQAGTRAGLVDMAGQGFWEQFGDPVLEDLVRESLLNNHDLRAGLARLDGANALAGLTRQDRWPSLGGEASASHGRSSTTQLPGSDRGQRDSDHRSANLIASWELDFFGRVRRSIEAGEADAEASAADLAALQVVVAGELASTYFQLRGLQAQLDIARQNEGNQLRTVELVGLRRDAGLDSDLELDRSRTQLETTRARIPALEAAIAVSTHRIAVLAGRTPDSLPAGLGGAVPLPALPMAVAIDAPADLLRRRPDVAAAERRLAASTARIGVATADLFPRLRLDALIGSQAASAGDLFQRDSETRLVAFGIDAGFLDVGRVRARLAAANAATAADLARYEQVVLLALEETENALARMEGSGRENRHLELASAAGDRAAALARLRLEQGAIGVLDVLEIEDARLRAEDAFVQGRVRNTLAVVALYRAMAGGWPGFIAEESAPDERADSVAIGGYEWQPVSSLGWIDAREDSRAGLQREVAIAATGWRP